ncbi:MAG: hypothetical protein D3903_20005 [Candidatus Electrothrix sp. GM3_4]|nr:hypothetical protein [Candidatus Electrothrix sp. GM3_4]
MISFSFIKPLFWYQAVFADLCTIIEAFCILTNCINSFTWYFFQHPYNELIGAIESAKNEIINVIIDVRNTELKGKVRGRFLEFERFVNFNDMELGYFISTSNDILGQIEQDILERDLTTDNSLVPAYNILVPLQAAALLKNEDSPLHVLRRAQNLNEKFISQMKATITFRGYYDEDLAAHALWAKSSFTGESMGQILDQEEGYNFVLSGTFYAVSVRALRDIKSALN